VADKPYISNARRAMWNAVVAQLAAKSTPPSHLSVDQSRAAEESSVQSVLGEVMKFKLRNTASAACGAGMELVKWIL